MAMQYPARYYAGIGRQRGSGIGSVVLGVGRTALPYLKPVAKGALAFGKDFAKQVAPELIDSLLSRSKPRGSELRKAAAGALKRQVGGGGKRRKSRGVTKSKAKRKKASVIRSKKSNKRSRLTFFSNVKNDY